ncbi:MAG: hypothetical protein CMN21_14810 [Rubinisphaera sp.]|nr:hypothetical protein [Rubinisphaera sp.]
MPRQSFMPICALRAPTKRIPLISMKELPGMGIVIFLSLGNYTHSFLQEGHHTISRYRSTYKTIEHRD